MTRDDCDKATESLMVMLACDRATAAAEVEASAAAGVRDLRAFGVVL